MAIAQLLLLALASGALPQHDPRGYHEAVAVFTAQGGWCRSCNALARSGLLDRMRSRTTVIVFNVDRPFPPGVNRQAIRGVPRILLYRDGQRVGDWSGYSMQIEAQITAALDDGAAQPQKGK